MPPSESAKAQARIVSSWRRWSKTTIASVIISAMSGSPSGSGFGLAERLDGADQVVAEEADGAADEGRQALDRGRPEVGEAGGDGGVGVGRRLAAAGALAGGGLLPAPLREGAVAPAQDRARAQADERVAADLALLGRLEQEGRARPRARRRAA